MKLLDSLSSTETFRFAVNGERAQIGQNDFLKALKDYRTTKVVSNVPRINAPAGMFFTLA